MHSNLALISRHPHAENNHACIIISPNLPRAETAGLGGGSVQCMRSNSSPRLSRSRVTIHDCYPTCAQNGFVPKMMTHPAGKGARGAQHIVLDMKSYRNRNRILSIIGAGDGGGYGGGGRRFLEGCGEGRGGKEEHFCLRTFGAGCHSTCRAVIFELVYP